MFDVIFCHFEIFSTENISVHYWLISCATNTNNCHYYERNLYSYRGALCFRLMTLQFMSRPSAWLLWKSRGIRFIFAWQMQEAPAKWTLHIASAPLGKYYEVYTQQLKSLYLFTLRYNKTFITYLTFPSQHFTVG